MHLQSSVRKFYSPGLQINIRIEDLGADWIYRDADDDINEEIQFKIDQYSQSMVTLIEILADSYNITPIRESWLMTSREQYFRVSEEYSLLLNNAITKKLAGMVEGKEMIVLRDKGWKGDLTLSQIHHYINRYKILYPDDTLDNHITRLSDYFGGSKARYDLNGRAVPINGVNSFINISFVAPIPGAPKSLFNNTLYYRTVPEKESRSHIAPWRAKGYLEIDSNNTIKTKITNWHDSVVSELIPMRITFEKPGKSVEVQIDYLVKEIPFILPAII